MTGHFKTAPDDETAPEGAREKILRIAAELIAEKGIHRTSLALIADKAGISRGTLFYYFPSKQSLLYQIMADSFQAVTDKIMKAIDHKDAEGKPEEILFLALKFIGEARSLNQINFHLFHLAIAGDTLLTSSFQKSYREWIALIAARLQENFPQTTAHLDPLILSAVILALIDGISIQALLESQPVDYRQMARLVSGLFVE